MTESPENGGRRRRSPVKTLSAWMRWLHIYSSMLGLLALLFFAVTGVTLNHADWFFSENEQTEESSGTLEKQWLHGDGRDEDPEAGLDKLAIVEEIRRAHGVHGALSEFTADEIECFLVFKGPGYFAEVVVDRETGEYTVTEGHHGFVAYINDLHKGRDTGAGWSWIIDVSAVVMTLASVTGLVVLFAAKRRRRAGLAVGLVGAILVVFGALLLVP